ncbi:small RNA 2'-O-methyltransferase [Xiphophorus hellerii]|uniref:small RNA 2'-O-methyltransferase n=1 Tax=Xiphophorus hellerii TaxID=8084 RepID=UPI0013B35EE4|nr:small RNA 2'-O-methyltransferase [Xiphophorus hellerii]
MNPIFTPSLHSQRHQFVVDFVRKNKPTKVADLGCGECSLLKQLKFQRSIELLVGVDINGAKIKKNMLRLAPLSTDYLQPTFDQLHIDLYQGSVTQRDARLTGFDLVTSIELIEHLTLPDLELFSSVVFGYMRPANVIISTPNSEFNKLFSGLTGFRHSDHKFEWNRSEFRSWALKVCLDYGYEAEFTGVGEAPQELQESVGFCSQIGVFQRTNVLPNRFEEEVFFYTLVYSVNYPTLCDNNTFIGLLLSEVLYRAEQMKNSWMEKTTGGTNWGLPHSQTEQRKQSACTERLDCPGEGEELTESLWTTKQEESGTLNRFVVVPLAALCSFCPKIAELSGNLSNLRRLLMDQPQVKLSQDGFSLLVKCEEQGTASLLQSVNCSQNRLTAMKRRMRKMHQPSSVPIKLNQRKTGKQIFDLEKLVLLSGNAGSVN